LNHGNNDLKFGDCGNWCVAQAELGAERDALQQRLQVWLY
jgi:hypothetical protein